MSTTYSGNVVKTGQVAYWQVTLPTSKGNILFLVDTGSPRQVTFNKQTIRNNKLVLGQTIRIFNYDFVIRQSLGKYAPHNVIGTQFFIKTKSAFRQTTKTQFIVHSSNFPQQNGGLKFVGLTQGSTLAKNLEVQFYNFETSKYEAQKRNVLIDTGANLYTTTNAPMYLTKSFKQDQKKYDYARILRCKNLKLGENFVETNHDLAQDLVGPSVISNQLFWFDGGKIQFGLIPAPVTIQAKL